MKKKATESAKKKTGGGGIQEGLYRAWDDVEVFEVPLELRRPGKEGACSDPSGLCLCRHIQIQCTALLYMYVRFIHHTRDTHGVDKMCRTVA